MTDEIGDGSDKHRLIAVAMYDAEAGGSRVAQSRPAEWALDSAVTELRAAGIPVIVSAGNLESDACRASPGNSNGTVVVGASAVGVEANENGIIKTIDRRSPNTAYGACLNIHAPGDSVLLPSLGRIRQAVFRKPMYDASSGDLGHPSPHRVLMRKGLIHALWILRQEPSVVYPGPEGGEDALRLVIALVHSSLIPQRGPAE